MALYFDNEGVHELLHVMTPTKTLEAYGLLDRAKQGYNPFRNDQHPTSFRKPKRPDCGKPLTPKAKAVNSFIIS